MPSRLGSGYIREVELCSGLHLEIFHETYREDFTYRGAEHPHLVQFMVHLSEGDSSDFLYPDTTQSYIGGSDIQPAVTNFHRANQSEVGVNIHVQPRLFHQFFASPGGDLAAELRPLIRGEQCQNVFSPKVTGMMRSVVQQMIGCPFVGVTKRLYLQGKVFELMALQLDGLLSPVALGSAGSLRPEMIARIHDAAEILRSRLDSPPTQLDLARRVGVSDRTLQKGFKAIFGMTPFAYLTQQRMQWAEQLLRQSDQTVTEVANLVGYANSAQFAAAFKRQFGISPRECLK